MRVFHRYTLLSSVPSALAPKLSTLKTIDVDEDEDGTISSLSLDMIPNEFGSFLASESGKERIIRSTSKSSNTEREY